MSIPSKQKRHVPTKRTGVYRTREGSKVFEVRYSRDGKQVYETVGTFEQAVARHAEIVGKKHKGEKIADPTKEFADVVADWREARKLKPRTATSYDANLRLYVLPRWGKTRVRDIDRAELKRWLAGLPPHLSGGTRSLILAVFSGVLDHAVECDYISINPCRQLSRRDKPRQGKIEARILGDGELDALLKACGRRAWLRPIILAALYAGLRLGEIVALDWRDIDFEANKIRVERALGKDGNIGTPKGGVACVIDLLTPLRKVLIEMHIKVGRPASGPVFCNSLGAMRQPRDVQRAFSQARDRAKLSTEPRSFRFHDLRHTCASYLVNGGSSPTWCQRHLRHANLQTTLSYMHVVESVEAVETAASAFGPLTAETGR